MAQEEILDNDVDEAIEQSLMPMVVAEGEKPGKKRKNNGWATPKQIETILRMTVSGCETHEIVAATGLHRNSIWRHQGKFKEFISDDDNSEDFIKGKSEILSAIELKLLKAAMDEDKLKQSSVANLVGAFSKINHANRLERGLSTSNVSAQVSVFTRVNIQDLKPDVK